ncbi:MAG: GntR family transcriptional regulator [Candidatus Nanopelagicales bacterium]
MKSESLDQSASQRIAQILEVEILSGVIDPGTRIRQEEVAERLGSSRLPVREALRILAANGLIQLETNKGARIPQLDKGEVDVLYRMRERLEPLALSESMPHADDRVFTELEEIQAEIEAGVSVSEFLQLDRRFHLLTYSKCPTEDLKDSVSRLWNSTAPYRRAFMKITGPQRQWIVNSEHWLIIDAMRRFDAKDGERYLVGHIRRTRKELAIHPELFPSE